MAADYRHIGGVENRLGRHYSRFSPFSPTPALADQSLARRKLWNAGSNRRSRARGEKRPADVIGNAVKVMRIATGEETEEIETDRAKSAAAELGSRGGKARAARLTKDRRSEIARKAAEKRWKS